MVADEFRLPVSAFRFGFALAVVCLGLSAVLTQVTLMREMLSVFSGNELVLGVVLGAWLLLFGAGCSLGRFASRLAWPLDVFLAAQVVLAVVPLAGVFLLRTLRNVVFVRGAAVGVSETVLSCFALLAPYCLLAGFLLTLASVLFDRHRDPRSIGQVYFFDNVGSVAGGLLFSFVLVRSCNHFEILYTAAGANLALACWLAWAARRGAVLAGALAAAAGLGAMVLAGVDLDGLSIRLQYAGQEVVENNSRSPYGHLVVTRLDGQYNFIENGVPLLCTQNIAAAEEMVHYAMAQRPEARRVLVIAGGIAGAVQELLDQYRAAVDYVELDPLVVQVARSLSAAPWLASELGKPAGQRRVHLWHTDGRVFVRQTPHRYDVVLVNLPDPTTSQLNRFYTREFFADVKRALAPDGVLSFSLGEYENRVSPELARLVAVAHRTLKEEFQHVLILPTGRLRFLASDGPLTSQIAERLEGHGVRTEWVTRHRLAEVFTPGRMAEVRRPAAEPAPVNRDFSPILYYYLLLHWISEFEARFGLLEGVLLVLLAAFLIRLRPVALAVFTTGLAASGLEVVLLLGFQVLFGSVYHRVGLIVTMFMLGLGIGSFWMTRTLARRSGRDLALLVLGLGVLGACLPAVLFGLGRLGSAPLGWAGAQAAIYLLTLLLAILVGLIFPLAAKVDFESISRTASRLYTADYVGAALGALLVSTWLIPLIGVSWVCLLTAGLNAASGAVLLASRQR